MTYEDVPGWFNYESLHDHVLSRLRRKHPTGPVILVEVGCWAGRAVCHLAAKFKESGLAGKVYAVDNWKGSRCDGLDETIKHIEFEGRPLYDLFLQNVRDCGLADCVTAVREDSAGAARYFDDGQVDYCFIDADHSEGAVVRDIKSWLPKVKPGGILAGHDYDRQSVYDAVKSVLGELPVFGGHPRNCPVVGMTCWYHEVPK